MHWFKHICDSSSDLIVQHIESMFGLEGYARYFKILERITKEYNSDNISPPVSVMPWSTWQSFLKGKPKKIIPLLQFLEQNRVISVCIKSARSGNVLKTFLKQNENEIKTFLKQNDLVLEMKLIDYEDFVGKTSAGRVRKHRQDLKKNNRDKFVSCNVTETLHSRFSNVTETPLKNREQRKEKNTKKKLSTSSRIGPQRNMMLPIHGGNSEQQKKPGRDLPNVARPGAANKLLSQKDDVSQICDGVVDKAKPVINPACFAESAQSRALALLTHEHRQKVLAFVSSMNDDHGDDFVCQVVWWVTEYSKQKNLKGKLRALEKLLLSRRYKVSPRYRSWLRDKLCGPEGYFGVGERPPDKKNGSVIVQTTDPDLEKNISKSLEIYQKYRNNFNQDSCVELSQIN